MTTPTQTSDLDLRMGRALFRCHALSAIMADPKNKGDAISQGAKTAVHKMLKEIVFGVRGELHTRPIQKGLMCEDQAIQLLNHVLGTHYVKNTERRTNDWLSGEPDIIRDEDGTDIKTSWSSDTFPLTTDDAHDKTYEWQCRGYMMLFDKPRWHVAYCLLDTPKELIGYEDPAPHNVSHIPASLRVTRVTYERDAALEEKIKLRVEVAREYMGEQLEKINARRELMAFLNPESNVPLVMPPVSSATKCFTPIT